MDSTRRATIRFLVGAATAAACAALNAVRWMHKTSVDAPFETKLWFGLCAFAVVSGLVRFFYYRSRRDYFAEEMDHRRLLARGPFKPKS